MRSIKGIPLLSFLFFLNSFATPCFGEKMDEAIRLLRDQRTVAEDLVVQVKTVFKANTPEYNEAKRLYEIARKESSRFIEELTFSIIDSNLKDLQPSTKKTTLAANNFERYVADKTITLGSPFTGVLSFGEGILKASEMISKEIRAWFEYDDKKKKELSDRLIKLLSWKDWAAIT